MLALLALLLAAPAGGEEPALADAAQVARQLAVAREALDRVHRKESSALVELDRAEAQTRSAETATRSADREQARALAAEARAEESEAAARAELDLRLQALAPRLLARYRLLRQGRAAWLLESSSALDLVRRDAALDRLLATDGAAVRRARDARDALASATDAAASARREAASRAEAARAAALGARAAAGSREALLSSIRNEREAQEEVVAELVRAEESLAATVEALPRGEARGFGKQRSKLPPPVPGGVIEVPYGKVVNPKFNTVTFHRGLDVRAHEGAEVHAVGAGRVVHAGWFDGYGNLMIVDHGDGYYSLYAHLSAMGRQVGDPVAAGDLLGLLGDTGSLKGPYLYFELREDGKPVDPRAWLRR